MQLNKFFIVNETDRPCELLIAERRDDGKLYYINPILRKDKDFHGMPFREATPLENFGIEFEIENNDTFKGQLKNFSIATYEDGSSREWQGNESFSFDYKSN